MAQRYFILITTCFNVFLLSSCVNLGLNNNATPPTQVELASLQLVESSPHSTIKNWVLKVALPNSPQHLDTTLLTSRQIFGKTNITALNHYDGVRWRDSLPVIIQERLIEFLDSTHYFTQVLSPTLGTQTTHTLQLELKDFQVDYDSDLPIALVAWRAYLLNNNGELLATQNFKSHQKIKTDAMLPVLQGLNQAFQENSDKLLKWLISTP